MDKKGLETGGNVTDSSGRVSSGPSRAVEVLDREVLELFENDTLADRAGVLHLPLVQVATRDAQDTGPGRQTLETKTPRIGKRR